jgi:hypothetical protein
LGSRLFLCVGLVSWCMEERTVEVVGFMVDDRVPVGIARAHEGITILDVEMDEGIALGLNSTVVQLPAHSVFNASAASHDGRKRKRHSTGYAMEGVGMNRTYG